MRAGSSPQVTASGDSRTGSIVYAVKIPIGGVMRLWHLLALCAHWWPALVAAQAPGAQQVPRRWTVTVYLGSTSGSGGPARGLEAAMTASGYTEPFGGCAPFFGCVPESPSPSSYSHANPWLLSVRYDVRPAIGAEFLVGQAMSGSTSGNRSGETLNIEYGGTIFAPLAFAGTGRFRAGTGPALLRGRWDYRDSRDGSRDRVTTHTLGWIGSAALGLPIWSSVEIGVTGQYRGFRRTTVGPAPAGAPSLPSATVRASHWYVAGGLGVRF